MKLLRTFLYVISVLSILLLIFAIGFKAGQKYDIAFDENDDYVAISYSVNEHKMKRLLSLIDNHYVDNVSTDSLIDNTIKFVLSNLDPHSVYLDKDVTEQMGQEMSGYYIGIGAEYIVYHDTIMITRVHPKSANSDLLQFGDKVLKVDDSVVTGDQTKNADKLITGKPNTYTNLSIKRDNKILNLRAKRTKISNGTLSDSYMLNDDIGYIKLKRFGEHSYKEFKQALLTLNKQGMRTLIFDLRGNPGGLMKVAEKIADEFLKQNQLIVVTKDTKGTKQLIYATKKGSFDGKPLYILIDEESASASEIIAGAIQDNDAGTVVGRRSFGKGLVQREISLGDGTKVRLTTARYYTPSGRSIQKPYNNGNSDYMLDLSERYKRGEMFSLDSINVPDSLKFETVGGRTVYGGGGIIPDIFVPLDSMKYSVWYYTYKNRQHFDEKIINYLKENHSKFENMKEETYLRSFDPKPLAQELISEIKYRKIAWKPDDETYFENLIKGTIASYIYGNRVSERVWAKDDNIIKLIIDLENK